MVTTSLVIALAGFVALWLVAALTRFWRHASRGLRIAHIGILALLTVVCGLVGFAVFYPGDCDSTPQFRADGTVFIPCIPPGGTVEIPVTIPVEPEPPGEPA